MKKRLFIYCAALTAILSLVPSCMDLNEVVDDKISADSFGKNEAEINAIVGSAYRTLNLYLSQNFIALTQVTGDMALFPSRRGGDWWDGGQYRELQMHEWTANNNTVRGSWNRATQSISTCNLIYSIVEEKTDLDPAIQKRILAEIKGLRAFWLYVMLDNWGNIPLKIDFKDTSLPSVTSRKDTYDFIMKELNEIKDLLRDDVTALSYGKFTRGSAYTLLAKMYLNAAAWGVDAPRWQEVVNACDEVIKLPYVIEPVWKTSFNVNNETSREAILAACYSVNDQSINGIDYRSRLFTFGLHYKDNIALGHKPTGNNGLCAQPDYVRLFDESDLRFTGSFLLGPMIDPATGEVLMTAHDRPLIHTIDVTIIPGTERDGTVWGDVNQEDGARMIKWPYDKALVDAMENDFHVFRLADVYLMKAEALVRLGRDNAEATRLVNVIRERGYGNAGHNYTAVTLDEIFLERRLEFAWELMSRQDCIRFGTFQNPRFLKPDTHGKDYMNIFPIPQTAWQANSKLVQNPGYPAF